MMFEEVHMPLSLWRQKTIYITLTPYLTEMHANTCFALQVKRSPSLPTVLNKTNNVYWRRRVKFQALAFQSDNISQKRNGNNATTAPSCGKNMLSCYLIIHHSTINIYCGGRLRVLLQSRGVLCEVPTEFHIDLLILKASMTLAPPQL